MHLNTDKLVFIRMSKENPKVKLTITIDKKILDSVKKVSEQKHVPLSGAIENFLEFFMNPYVYCFKCGKKFTSKEAKVCTNCGWMICPHCNACGCALSEETLRVAFYMRRTYEDLLIGRVK